MSYVLIVDDDGSIRRLLHRWVDAEGVRAVEATSAEQGLLIASQEAPAVALCDIQLPRGQNGFWLVEHLRRLYPETVAVMTTGVNAFDAAVTGIRAGVIDYVVKPFSRAQVSQALARAVAEHQSRISSGAARDQAGNSADDADRRPTAGALLTLLQAQDQNAAQHAQRVSRVALMIATTLDLGEPQLADIMHAALLRDVTRLDVHAIARTSPPLAAAYAIAMVAQERFDGTGFPQGLKGESIPLGARILGIAEAYDELVSGMNGPASTPAAAVETLRTKRAQQFDPVVLRALEVVPIQHAA
jgi:putative two-component system response regulator